MGTFVMINGVNLTNLLFERRPVQLTEEQLEWVTAP